MKQIQDAVISVWPLFFGLAFLMLGNGLQGTLLGVRAEGEGFAVFTIGIIMSLYYAGFLLGSIIVPKLIAGVGHIRVFAALASMASAAVLLHVVFLNPWIWMPVRALTGFSFAGLYLIIESWLNDRATNETRGQILSIYFIVLFAGLSLGQGLLNLADPLGVELFILTSVLVSCALVPISLSRRPAPDFHAPETISLRRLYVISPLALIGVFINGLGTACLFTITPVFASQQGYSLPEISILMAAFIVGGVVFQGPIGWLSDKIDRRRVIILVSILSFMAGIACAVGAAINVPVVLYATIMVFGGLSLSIYGLCISHANDHLDKRYTVAISASLLLFNAFGACFGPVGIAFILQIFGYEFFFPIMAVLYAVLCVFGVYRTFIRPPVPEEEQEDYMSVPVRSGAVLYQIAEEEDEEQDEEQEQGK